MIYLLLLFQLLALGARLFVIDIFPSYLGMADTLVLLELTPNEGDRIPSSQASTPGLPCHLEEQ